VRVSACDELVGQAVNIAHGEEVSIGEVAELLLEIMHAGSLQPERDEPRPGDVERHFADIRKAREMLGFAATIPIREGLERYVAWIERTSARPAPDAAAVVRNW
jgi:UDP-glucose 4-epimerase